VKQDTLIGQTALRALKAIADEHIGAGRDSQRPASLREKASAVIEGTKIGSNVASLVVEWALVMDDLGVEDLGVERFVEYSIESRRTVYRRMRDFRRCWPEYDNPSPLARFVLEQARSRGERPAPSTPIPLVA
jgi:hypothetical protein